MTQPLLEDTFAAQLAQLQQDVQALNTHAIQTFADRNGRALLTTTGLQTRTTHAATKAPGGNSGALTYGTSWTNYSNLFPYGGPTNTFQVLAPATFATEPTLVLILGAWQVIADLGATIPKPDGVDFPSGTVLNTRATLFDSLNNIVATSPVQYQFCDASDGLQDTDAEVYLIVSLDPANDAGNTTTTINGATWDVGSFYVEVQYQYTSLISGNSCSDIVSAGLDVLLLGGN